MKAAPSLLRMALAVLVTTGAATWPSSGRAQDAAPADRNAINTAARPGDMMADSPVTFPQEGALPSQFPPDVRERSEPVEKDYYLFSSPCRSLEQIRAIQEAMPHGTFTAPPPDWTHLRRTRRLLTQGGDLRLLAVGDSIVNDTMRSGWVALLQEAYPRARIEATVYVRGGGGCQHYREENRVATNILPRRPDLVFIGGISQRDIASIRDVIRQVRAGLPEVEFLLATGTFGTADPRDAEALARASHSGTGAYGQALKALAAEERCAYLDMTGPWAEYIRSSDVHPHRFYRDAVHANEFGEQILAKILLAFWTADDSAAVDFRYAPPEWQTAICLPDDPHKSIVDRSGELLYHYRQGGREFGTRVAVEVAEDASWQRQDLLSPRVPIVRTFRSAAGLQILEEAFAITASPNGQPPAATLRQSDAEPGQTDARGSDSPLRADIVLVHLTNTGTTERTLTPRLVVDTRLPFRFQTEPAEVRVDERERIGSSLRLVRVVEEEDSRRVIALAPLTVAGGATATFFILHGDDQSVAAGPGTVRQALACRREAVKYWERAPLPVGRIQVPDPGIQALLDSSIRNIWQAREIKQGLPVFQVGPTCYRGLWIVDGAFLLEAAALLGAGPEARSGIAFTLAQQKPTGAFEVLSPHYYKENGIVLWTCVRHALLTQDKAWLQSVWPQLERAALYITELRRLSLTNDTPLDDGLNPPGEIDGGLSGQATGFRRPEFSNVHWNLLGLRAFVHAADWLGDTTSATRWQREYDDLEVSFRRAAARDLRQDTRGNAYVPIFMANAGNELPQRGQWTFCHAVYPGQIFPQDDPLVAGTLAMLEATEREGMVYGTGWDAAGIWNYFASFYGHAWLWQGNGPKAARTLTAFANHAAPTLVWREEQSLKGEPFRKVGDMPHNWASAEFIRLAVHLLALDRGDELHLLEGFPPEWAGPGRVTRLSGVATPFGPLHMTVRGQRKGTRATLTVQPLGANCKALVVHLPDGGLHPLDPRRGGRVTFNLPPLASATPVSP